MNLMEATVFAILLSSPQPPFQCRMTPDEKSAICSTDLTIAEGENGKLTYSNNVTVEKNRKRELVFSNGYALRRMEGEVFRVAPPNKANDMLCRYTQPKFIVRCTPA